MFKHCDCVEHCIFA